MHKLFLVVLLLAGFAHGVKYNGTTSQFSCTASNVLIAGNFPMTVTSWVQLNNTTVGVMVSSADNSTGGWKFDDEGANATDNLAFVKSHIVVISAPVALALAQNTWTFAAAVVTSTNIHFYMLVGNTATTGDTSNSSSFAAAGSNGKTCQDIVNSGVATVLQPLAGSLGEACVWGTTALTDLQLHMVATQGCHAMGIQPTAYWPSQIMSNTLTRGADVVPPGTRTFTNLSCDNNCRAAPPPVAPSLGEMH